jgi:transcriptional regulator of met regulon
MMTPEPPQYTISVKVALKVKEQLHAEQARRTLRGEKKPTIAELASELITQSAEGLVS